MVRWWDVQIDKGIALTKERIKHLEKHGNGDSVMYEKQILKKQERHRELEKAKGRFIK